MAIKLRQNKVRTLAPSFLPASSELPTPASGPHPQLPRDHWGGTGARGISLQNALGSTCRTALRRPSYPAHLPKAPRSPPEEAPALSFDEPHQWLVTLYWPK